MRALIIAALVSVAACGCGSSIRVQEQSRTFFERCYSIDLDAAAPMDAKEECWSDWLADYVEGQPPEVVAYASDRLRGLRAGEALPPLPGHGPESAPAPPIADTAGPEASPEGESLQSIAEPTAPSTEASDDRPVSACGDRRGQRPPRCPSPPNMDEGPCAEVCNPRWYRCAASCYEPDRRCLEACEVEHRTCMGGCY